VIFESDSSSVKQGFSASWTSALVGVPHSCSATVTRSLYIFQNKHKKIRRIILIPRQSWMGLVCSKHENIWQNACCFTQGNPSFGRFAANSDAHAVTHTGEPQQPLYVRVSYSCA
jgi:hypothetical protein